MKSTWIAKSRILFVALITATSMALPTVARAGLLDEEVFSTVENTCNVLGEQKRLLKTFADSDAALDRFKQTYPEFIQEVKELGVPDLSEETAYDYKTYAIASGQCNEIIQFLDIYENKASNDERAMRLGTIDAEYAQGEIDYDQAASEIDVYLPLNQSSAEPARPALQYALNLSAAQNYAAKYAVTPNSTYGVATTWYGIGADCTNFASQILYAGGIPMNTFSSTSYGWWWKGKGEGNCSISWIRASTFSRYMGSNFNTTSWSNLKSNVKAGDCIGFDESADGDMDHIGFVYSKSGSSIQIAQHSDNYLKWDSATGWPGLENGTTRFYRIGR